MTDIQETQEIPKWLKELEEKREKRLKARLGHEAGAGSPCLTCGEKCPGLDLHFWRKICKNCKCGKESHDVHDDDIYGWAQFQLLGSKPEKPCKIVLPGKKEAVELEWTPKGQNDLVESYLKNLPQDMLPIKGSAAAQERKQLLQKQIPLHDIDPTLCDALSESEIKQMNDYIAHIKQNSVGVGRIVKLNQLNKGNMHNIPKSDAQILANRVSLQLPNSQTVYLQGSDRASILKGKNKENYGNSLPNLQDLSLNEDKEIDPIENDQRMGDNKGKVRNKRVELKIDIGNYDDPQDQNVPNNIPKKHESKNVYQDPKIGNRIKDINYPIYSSQIRESSPEPSRSSALRSLERNVPKLSHYPHSTLVNQESIQNPIKANVNDVYAITLPSENCHGKDSPLNILRNTGDNPPYFDSNGSSKPNSDTHLPPLPPQRLPSDIFNKNRKTLSPDSDNNIFADSTYDPNSQENKRYPSYDNSTLLPPVPPLPQNYTESEFNLPTYERADPLEGNAIKNYVPGKFNTFLDNRNPQVVGGVRDIKYPSYFNSNKLPQNYYGSSVPQNEQLPLKYPEEKVTTSPDQDEIFSSSIPQRQKEILHTTPLQHGDSRFPINKTTTIPNDKTYSSNPQNESLTSRYPQNKELPHKYPQNQVLTPNYLQSESLGSKYSHNEDIIPKYPQNETLSSKYPQNESLTPGYPIKEGIISKRPQNETSPLKYPVNESLVRYPRNETEPSNYPPGESSLSKYPQSEESTSKYPQKESLKSRYPPVDVSKYPQNKSSILSYPEKESLASKNPEDEVLTSRNPSNETFKYPQNNSLIPDYPQNEALVSKYPQDENLNSKYPQDENLNPKYPQNEAYLSKHHNLPHAVGNQPHRPLSYSPNKLMVTENSQDPIPISIGAIHDIEYPLSEIRQAAHKQNEGFYDPPLVPNVPQNEPESIFKLPQCHRCKKMFEENSNVIGIERTDALWHSECFKCAGCNQNLADWLYFYHKESDDIYCGRDYAKIRGIPRCKACDELIFVKEYCLAENNTFHVKHFCCFQCDDPLAGKNYVMEDSQPYCLPCFEKLKAEHCITCKSVIKPDQAGANLNGVHFHADDTCFSCVMCKKPLLGSKFLFRNQRLYCSALCLGTDKRKH